MSNKGEEKTAIENKQNEEKVKKPRKPVYLKDRKTSSGVTFGV